ncbi:TraB/GumN family protein [Telluria aromaticivorans]|uniref:TraB/GumN family protein n=1 Tax=Telluria aromaticivorans TaxID=2725995 RepID=A0A7Y2K1U7_9BURK|nr:TraB/GumN family protein [Telluria aromaticivorans]NNG25127.1 TraB/GumN family protein [Telluria aromaticivorans]
MLKFALLPALCLAFVAAPSWGQSADPAAPQPAVSTEAPAEATAAPEQILVVGQKPGPGMWKVSKDDHVLWIFGTYSPLPVKMDWRSHEVEAVIGRSQEYLAPPMGKVDIGYLQGLMALPLLIGINDNPDGATLRDVLPADVYARWLPLKEKYLPKNKERERPIFVANQLFSAAMKQAGLTTSTDVRKQVEKIVDARKLTVTKTVLSLPIENARRVIKDFKKSPLDDAACFAATLSRLETDIEAMRLRANAWAKGDIDGIRKLDFVDQQESCTNVIMNSAAVRDNPTFQGAEPRLRAMWLANAEAALARNASTFAVLAMKDVLNPKGYLAMLAAKGYKVEQPE